MAGGYRRSGGTHWLRRIAVLAIVLLVAYGGVSWAFSSKLIAQNFPSEPEVAFADFGLPDPENIAFANGDINLVGWYFANPNPANCATILVHGFTSNKAEVLIAAPLFWDRGCDVMAYDLRGHGQSSPGKITYGVKDKFDLIAGIDWLERRTGLSDGQIGLMGWSWGAATSLQAATTRPDLAFVIADASFSSLKAISEVQAEAQFGSWAKAFVPGALLISRFRADFNPNNASPEDAVRGLKTPVLLVHSTTDEFTPSTHSEAIYAKSDHSQTVLQLTEWGAPHSMSYPTDPVAYTRFVDDFLGKFAPGFGRERT